MSSPPAFSGLRVTRSIVFYVNKRQRIMKGKSKNGNRDKQATQCTQDEEKKKNKPKTQHNMRWTPLYVNKHKKHK